MTYMNPRNLPPGRSSVDSAEAGKREMKIVLYGPRSRGGISFATQGGLHAKIREWAFGAPLQAGRCLRREWTRRGPKIADLDAARKNFPFDTDGAVLSSTTSPRAKNSAPPQNHRAGPWAYKYETEKALTLNSITSDRRTGECPCGWSRCSFRACRCRRTLHIEGIAQGHRSANGDRGTGGRNIPRRERGYDKRRRQLPFFGREVARCGLEVVRRVAHAVIRW
jgi:hypothetical protein